LRWLGFLLFTACAEPSVVLVSAENLPAGTTLLAARYTIDDRPSDLRSSWPPPAAGWGERFTFVVALPAGTKGTFGVELAARDAGGCLVGGVTTSAVLDGEDRQGLTAALVPFAEARCGDCDADTDGFTDEGCLAEAPVLVTPANGHRTGVGASARIPPLRWRPVAGAAWYELQREDDCVPWTGLAACVPRSPLVRVDGTGVVPTLDLSPPGHPVVWRVRACADAGCGPWSPRRYFHAGRSLLDVDGDGVENLIVSEPSARRGGVYAGVVHVFPRLATGGVSVTVYNKDREAEKFGKFGERVDCVGDVDGDGFPEFVVSDASFNLPGGESGLFVFLGGAAGPSVERSLLLGGEPNQYHRAVGGDLDGDGFDDMVVGLMAQENSQLMVYFGGPGFPGQPLVLPLPATTEAIRFGRYPNDLAIGDWDADGLADIAASAPDLDGQSGLVVLVRGRADRDLARSFSVRFDPAHQADGALLASGDVDGDGLAELVSLGRVGMESWELLVHGPDGRVRPVTLPMAADVRPTMMFVRDLDGDGRGEIVVSGRMIVILLSVDDITGPQIDETIVEEVVATYGDTSAAIDPGDGVPRLVVGAPGENIDALSSAGVVHYRDGGVWKRVTAPVPTNISAFGYWLP
jgi:hypothetical protein